MFVSKGIPLFAELLRKSMCLFIDLQNELKLAQILSLQPVYLHCYIFHPLYVNGGALYFM